MLSNFTKLSKSICANGKVIDLNKPIIMGILNITQDSFFSESRLNNEDSILETAFKMLQDGATILDIGAQSTRPNATEKSESEEIEKACWAIELILKKIPNAIISIDTFRANVAKEAVNAGAHIINDVCGGNGDDQMFETVAKLSVPYILGHNKGNMGSMHNCYTYQNISYEVLDDLEKKVAKLRALSIKDIIIDPGFGFSKNLEQNYALFRKLELLHMLHLPIMIGVSRKSMIYKLLNIDPQEALNGTSVLHSIAISKGAHILRVHDVKEANELLKICSKIFFKEL
jgi:dihydropteroate synthase